MTTPEGISLEQTVLGHALNDSSCFKLLNAEVTWDDFTVANHRVIAFCLEKMSDLGVNIPDEDSFQLVVPGFPEEEKDYGGVEYIRKLKASFIEPTQNYEKFIQAFKVQSAKHKISDGGLKQLFRLSNDPTATVDDIKSVLKNLSEVVETADSSGYNFRDTTELADKYQEELATRAERQFDSTGFQGLDENLTEGFAKKKISVVAGFTGMAKSTVVINMAHRIAASGRCAAIFSMETTDVSLYDKVISTLTQIPLTRLKKESADLSDEERGRIASCLAKLRDIPLLINDQASVSIDGILYQIQSARRRGHNPEVVFIDLFGKVEDVDTGDNLATRIQKECKRMRVLAKQLDIHFCLVVQIGRSGFGRQRGGIIRRPTLIDIKNANAYAEECDLAILLHRNKYYIPDLEDDILEFDIAKQRDGEANVKVYYELFADTSTIIDTERLPHDIAVG